MPLDLRGCDDLAVVNGLRRRIAAVMWEGVGILRSDQGICQARLALEGIKTLLRDGTFHRRVLETCNMAKLGDAIAASAAYRTESRGGHFREDFPHAEDAWRRPTRLLKEGDGHVFLEVNS